MAIVLAQQLFKGANGFINPKRLLDGIGVNATDLDNRHGDMRGLRAASVVHTLTGLGTQQISAYRMGRDVVSDTQYWLTSNADVDYMPTLFSNDTTERTYYTDGVKPRFTDNTLLGSPPYPTSSYTLGVPAPSLMMSAALAVEGASTTVESRIYTDTFVRVLNGRVEESAPNSAVRSFSCKAGSTVTLSALAAMPSGSHGITQRRIYCSTDGGEFLRVGQVAATATSFVDNLSRSLVLQTGGSDAKPTWLEPPDNLRGLMALWNGMGIGFCGNTYRVCVPGYAHAWPLEYEAVLPYSVVGMASWGSSVLVCTTGMPYVAAGTTPAAISTPSPTRFNQSCVSKRSVVGMEHGVCWASPNGLCYYGQRGAMNLTESLLTQDAWRALKPETIIGVQWGVWYLGFYFDGANRKGFMVDTTDPTYIIWLSQGAYGVYRDAVSGSIYLLDSAYQVRKWDSGAILSAAFTTPNHRHQMESCPAFAKVVATTYPVSFTLVANGVDRYTKTVTDKEPFILPGGYMARDFQLRLSGTGPIEAALVADDITDIP